MITVRSTINLANQSVPEVIPAVQGDTGRSILFSLADFTIPTGATARYFITKPSGLAVYNDATIDGNTVLVDLTAQSLAEYGDCPGQVRIILGDDIVTSFEFILHVEPFRGIDAVESSTEANIFDKAVEKAAEDFRTEAETIAAEVIESIPPDYTALSNEVDDLSEDFYKLVGNIEGTWTNGGMYSATGIEYSSSSNIMTSFIKVNPGDTIWMVRSDTTYELVIYEFANNTTSSSGVNERLRRTTITGLSYRLTLLDTTNYVRFQRNTGDIIKGNEVLVYTTNNIVFDHVSSAISGMNGVDIINAFRTWPYVGTAGNITFSYDPDTKKTHVSGSTTGSSSGYYFKNLCNDYPVNEGDVIYIGFDSTGSRTSISVYGKKTSDGAYVSLVSGVTDEVTRLVIPTGYSSIYARINVSVAEAAVDEYVSAYLIDDERSFVVDYESVKNHLHALPSCDLDDLYNVNGGWILDGKTYDNTPNNYIYGFLTTERFGTWNLQKFVNLSASEIWLRRRNNSGSWSDWYNFIPDVNQIPMTSIYALGTNGESTDLNDLVTNRIVLLSDSYTYTNVPTGLNVGFVISIITGTWNLQLAFNFSGNRMWKRKGKGTGSSPSWEDWQEITGSGNTYNVTNNYEFPSYSETVTVNASPQITTDTNSYLAPTGDTTDRTAEILAMLTSNGICRLGAGDYYVSGLQMPDESSIIGSGSATQIILSGSSDGFAIKPGSYCTLSDFTLKGALTIPTFGENIGGRHGILWQGTYTENQKAPYLLRINNIYIANFTGGGITCYDTGFGTANGIEATNIFVKSCWAGLNISYWSEFHKFTNVRCWQCRIGCVNNGGNNVFVNCDFSSNYEIAMLMDNSQGQSPNNTHGSCVGCVFNHTQSGGQSNSGVGVKILNCGSGFIFTGCQIFFSKIHLEDSPGIVFANCNFGYSNCDIEISGGTGILFTGNIHQNKAPITITNNAGVHFVNCYNRTTGALIEP